MAWTNISGVEHQDSTLLKTALLEIETALNERETAIGDLNTSIGAFSHIEQYTAEIEVLRVGIEDLLVDHLNGRFGLWDGSVFSSTNINAILVIAGYPPGGWTDFVHQEELKAIIVQLRDALDEIIHYRVRYIVTETAVVSNYENGIHIDQGQPSAELAWDDLRLSPSPGAESFDGVFWSMRFGSGTSGQGHYSGRRRTQGYTYTRLVISVGSVDGLFTEVTEVGDSPDAEGNRNSPVSAFSYSVNGGTGAISTAVPPFLVAELISGNPALAPTPGNSENFSLVNITSLPADEPFRSGSHSGHGSLEVFISPTQAVALVIDISSAVTYG